MAETVLGIEPSVLDCLSWSETGDLAIAAGEHVELLIAKLRTGDDFNELWDIVHLRINDFDEREVPPVSPASFHTFSIGEEISSSEITALDWSSQGLTKHRRCALAILTANRALSIWTPGSDPRSPYAWTRELIVNRALDDYHVRLSQLQDANHTSKTSSRFQRINAFTWSSPALLQASPSQKLHVDPDRWGEHFLAVGNDTNNIVIMWIASQDSALTPKDAKLTAEPMTHFSVFANSEIKLPRLAWTFEDYMQNNETPTHIAWSPWIRWQPDNSLVGIIAYTTRTKLGFRQVNISITPSGRPKVQVGDHAAEALLPTAGATNGPLRWLPRSSSSNRMQLFISNGTAILRYDVAVIGKIDIKCSIYIRKEWDPISAFLFGSSQNGDVQLQIPSHISTGADSITVLDLGLFKPGNLDQNVNWKKKMLQHKDVFKQRNNLGENVVIKTWGMAALAATNLFAINFSLHPSRAVEYLIPSEAHSTILLNSFTEALDLSWIKSVICVENPFNAELLAFAIKYHLLQQSSSERQSFIDQILNTAEMILSVPIAAGEATSSVSPLVKLREALQTPAMKKERLKRLLVIFGAESGNEKFECEPNLRSSHTVNRPMEQLVSVAMLNISHNFAASTDTKSTAMVKSYLKASTLQMRQANGNDDALPKSNVGADEKCEICDADIPFESLTSAKCLEGHEFVRCALTFLAIQAPGISNFCGICSKQYLNEAYLESDHAQHQGNSPYVERDDANSESSDLGPSLARTLFAACETCVYCGGRYVG